MGRRVRVVVGVALALAGPAVAASPASASVAPTAYVAEYGANSVAALSIGSTGALSAVSGSPFGAGTNPIGIALTPRASYLYAINYASNNVSAFAVGADGSITADGSPVGTGTQPYALAVTPDGSHLYVANGGSSNVSGYSIGSNGTLTSVAGSPFTAGTGPTGVAVSPDGSHLYVTNDGSNNVSAFSIGADGGLTAISGSPFATGSTPIGIGVTPDGSHLYVANDGSNNVSGFSIGANGGLTAVAGSPFAAGTTPFRLAITPDGAHVYVANYVSNNVSAYSIGASGALSAVTGSPFSAGNIPYGIGVTPDGAHLYVANSGNNNVSGYAIAANGALSAVAGSPFAAGTTPAGLAITPHQGPVAAFSATPGPPGSASTFDGSASSDSGGTVVRYDWDFGDGTTDPNGGPTPTHTYAAAGNYTATLTVTDNTGCSTKVVFTGQTASCNGTAVATISEPVTVAAPPTCQALSASPAQNRSTQIVFNCTTSTLFRDTYSIAANPSHGTLSNLDPLNGTVTYTPNTGYRGPDSFSYEATNAGGSSSPTTVSLDVVDGTFPTISISSPAQTTYPRGAIVNAAYSCNDFDGPADVARCRGPVASGRPINTSSLGRHKFIVIASDRANNTAVSAVVYTVVAAPAIVTSRHVSSHPRSAEVLVDPGIEVACPRHGKSCAVALTATGPQGVQVGHARFAIRAGHSSELIFRLNGAGMRLLRHGRLRLTVTVSGRVGHNPALSRTKTVTVGRA